MTQPFADATCRQLHCITFGRKQRVCLDDRGAATSFPRVTWPFNVNRNRGNNGFAVINHPQNSHDSSSLLRIAGIRHHNNWNVPGQLQKAPSLSVAATTYSLFCSEPQTAILLAVLLQRREATEL